MFNSVIYVKDLVTVGISTGEQDRDGVAEIAGESPTANLQTGIVLKNLVFRVMM
jgi:AICAR transformylase/IMP cyclohydrolase PurH